MDVQGNSHAFPQGFGLNRTILSRSTESFPTTATDQGSIAPHSPATSSIAASISDREKWLNSIVDQIGKKDFLPDEDDVELALRWKLYRLMKNKPSTRTSVGGGAASETDDGTAQGSEPTIDAAVEVSTTAYEGDTTENEDTSSSSSSGSYSGGSSSSSDSDSGPFPAGLLLRRRSSQMRARIEGDAPLTIEDLLPDDFPPPLRQSMNQNNLSVVPTNNAFGVGAFLLPPASPKGFAYACTDETETVTSDVADDDSLTELFDGTAHLNERLAAIQAPMTATKRVSMQKAAQRQKRGGITNKTKQGSRPQSAIARLGELQRKLSLGSLGTNIPYSMNPSTRRLIQAKLQTANTKHGTHHHHQNQTTSSSYSSTVVQSLEAGLGFESTGGSNLNVNARKNSVMVTTSDVPSRRQSIMSRRMSAHTGGAAPQDSSKLSSNSSPTPATDDKKKKKQKQRRPQVANWKPKLTDGQPQRDHVKATIPNTLTPILVLQQKESVRHFKNNRPAHRKSHTMLSVTTPPVVEHNAVTTKYKNRINEIAKGIEGVHAPAVSSMKEAVVLHQKKTTHYNIRPHVPKTKKASMKVLDNDARVPGQAAV